MYSAIEVQIKGVISGDIVKKLKNPNKDRIKYLKSLPENIITLSQFKELKKLKKEKKKETIKLSEKIFLSKTNENLNYEKHNFYLSKLNGIKELCLDLPGEDCVSLVFTKNDKGNFICNKNISVKSKYNAAEDVIIDIVKFFKLSCQIKDTGNEQDGYEGEDGCEGELEPTQYYVKGKISDEETFNKVKNDIDAPEGLDVLDVISDSLIEKVILQYEKGEFSYDDKENKFLLKINALIENKFSIDNTLNPELIAFLNESKYPTKKGNVYSFSDIREAINNLS